MKNLKKKGFTIVELVIVIAVIAVLAAVLIPTFVNLTKKANMSSDQVAVKNMNTLLATEFATEKPTEFRQVIDMLDKNGYNVDALTPLSKGYAFVWNQAENKIELVEISAAGEAPKLETGASFINVEVSTDEELISALANGSDVTLTADIHIDIADKNIDIEKGDVTLNLNGHTLSSIQNASNGRSTVVYIRDNASLTVENGTLNVRSLQNYGDLTIKSNVTINAVDVTGGACINNKPGGNVVIEGGTFNVVNFIAYDETNKGGAVAVQNEEGNIIINDGSFKSVTDAYLIANKSGTLTINGGSFESYRGGIHVGGGSVIINNGSFKINGGSTASAHGIYVGNGNVEVNKATISYTESNGGKTFYVAKDTNGLITIKKGVVYNGNTISVEETHKSTDIVWSK